jgi:catalase
MRMDVPLGRVNYEPNSFAPDAARENPARGFRSFVEEGSGGKLRVRAELFADHYSQARLFFRSQTGVEQDHIVAALIFELSKVQTEAIRVRVVSRLLNIDEDLGLRVSAGLGLGDVEPADAAMEPKDMEASDALSIVKKAKPSLKGRTVGLLVSDGADAGLVAALQKAITASGAKSKIVAEHIAGAELSDGKMLPADQRVDGGPSSLFDAVAIVASDEGAARLAGMGAAQDFVRDAFGHLKAIGFSDNLSELFAKAGLAPDDLDDACVPLAKRADAARFVDVAAQGKVWTREPNVRPLPRPDA